MFESTLIMIKPDAVAHEDWLAIIHMYKDRGIRLVHSRLMNPMPVEIARELYQEHEGKSFFDGLMAHMTQGITMAFLAHGEEVIAQARVLNGSTNPTTAAFGTIRAKYGTGGPANAVHASENAEAAQRELALIFPK